MKNLNFIQLDPRVKKEDQPSYDLWIEVTIPGMKNDIDHHGETSHLPPAIQQVVDKMWKWEIKDLFEWKEEVKLATVRPDLDSVWTMAIIKSDNEGKSIDKKLVRLISILDQYGPLWLTEDLKQWDETERYKKIINAMNTVVFDFKKWIDEKVLFVQDYLSWNIDDTFVEEAWIKKIENDKKIRENSKITELVPWKLVFIESSERGALWLWYELAPTVIAVNDSMPVTQKDENWRFKPTWEVYKKYTIAKSTEAIDTDIQAIMEELNSLESWRGWRWTIMWSPQNKSSKLSKEQVIDIVKQYTK